jgi:thiosulfate/3-mercaptopyruvate sulfurtransferase
MPFTTLISCDELGKLQTSGDDIVIVDCRFDLGDVTAGIKDYQAGHIEGAFYAHLDNTLSGQLITGKTGRHPLPLKTNFVDWLNSIGVNENTQIIAYDAANGAIAARLWWLCQWVGHTSCAVLNGGFKAWSLKHNASQAHPINHRRGSIVVGFEQVSALSSEAVLANHSILLIDARENARYLGDVEPIDPVSGHIPGALNLPFTNNLDENDFFISKSNLRKRFEPLHLQHPNKTKVMYCGSGVTAAHNIVAMSYAGLAPAKLYADSWSGWITDKNRPIATGENN